MTFIHRAAAAICVVITVVAPLPARAAGKAKHVVIVVMDGLRPDSVVAADMPNLTKMAKAGTFFAAHHPVYISSTEVNGAALATGARPGHNGITGNREYRPDVELLQPVDTQSEWASWRGDQVTGGKWIRVETLPQIVRAAGGKTVVAGTKPVAMLWDRGRENRTIDQPTLFGGQTIPGGARDAIERSFGPIPPSKDTRFFANGPQDQWTTRTLTDKLWETGLPALSVLWLSEPDYSQHGSGPGSKVARAALASSDACLGKLLAHLDQAGVRDQTDVMVVSDHGFSTVAAGVDIIDDLQEQKFEAGGAFLEKPANGSVMVVPLGGSIAFYVGGHDKETTEKLVKHLQTTPYAGVIFSRDGQEGAFKLSDVGMDSPDAADVIMSMRWTADSLVPDRKMPGALVIEGRGYKPGQGMHGSLSRFDMHNTLIAAGPDFRAGFEDKAPSANSDVAPTVLHILGIAPKEAMDGRVLSEALGDAKDDDAPKVETQVMEATTKVGEKEWRQYLKVSKVGTQRYYDEGNAGTPPK